MGYRQVQVWAWLHSAWPVSACWTGMLLRVEMQPLEVESEVWKKDTWHNLFLEYNKIALMSSESLRSDICRWWDFCVLPLGLREGTGWLPWFYLCSASKTCSLSPDGSLLDNTGDESIIFHSFKQHFWHLGNYFFYSDLQMKLNPK